MAGVSVLVSIAALVHMLRGSLNEASGGVNR
jgi:hypothetical protein